MKRPVTLLTSSYRSFPLKERSIRILLFLCSCGIAIGSFALVLTVGIMRGFEKETWKTMQGIHSDATINAGGHHIDYERIKTHLSTLYPTFIKGISGSSTRHVIIEHDEKMKIIFLRGIIPHDEVTTSSLHTRITEPSDGTYLETLLAPSNTVLLGKELAAYLRVKRGDTITIRVPEQGSRSIHLSTHEATVSGILSIGIEEYDTQVAYCSHETLNTFYDQTLKGVDTIALSLSPQPHPSSLFYSLFPFFPNPSTYFTTHIRKEVLPLTFSLWYEQYHDIVDALRLETYVMSLILGLITLVACMNLISLLFMLITHKRRDIALLLSLGMQRHDIANVFRNMSMYLTLKSLFIGMSSACVVGYCIDTYKLIPLSKTYLVSHVPVSIEILPLVLIALGTLFLGYIAGLIPLTTIRRFSVCTILQNS